MRTEIQPAGFVRKGDAMKKASGMIVLVLAALLVAMLVPAFAVAADNGAFAPTFGTKINVQEEVGWTFTAENMTAPAVAPIPALAALALMLLGLAMGAYYYRPIVAIYGSRGSTPGAGGDEALPRHS